MKTIHKQGPLIYGLNQIKCQVTGSLRVLHVGFDKLGALCLWHEADTSVGSRECRVFVIGTGHDMSEVSGTFLGTAINSEGFVWHVYSPDLSHVHIANYM